MKIQNFAINTAAIYQSGVTTGDTITMQLTHVTGGHLITFEPVILSYAPTFFTMQIECVIDISQQDLNDGKIWLIDGDGYYNYVIKKNNVTFESGQLFIQAPQQTIIENTPNNSVIITEFGAGSSGTSGSAGSSGAGIANYYASYSSTQTQPIVDNTSFSTITFNQIEIENGISLVDNTKITVSHSGIYEIGISPMIETQTNGETNIDIWFRKNGTDIVRSNSVIGSKFNSQKTLPYIQFIIELLQGEYVEVLMHSDNPATGAELIYVGTQTSPTRPSAPSIILDIKNVGVAAVAYTSTSGSSGQTGPSGTSGISGTSGQAGATGSSGSSGLNGTSGTSLPGAAGTSGINGTSGQTGSSGSSGQTGGSGTSGVSGIAGSSGSSGATGSSGSSGASGSTNENVNSTSYYPLDASNPTYSWWKWNVLASSFSGGGIALTLNAIRFVPVYTMKAGNVINQVAVNAITSAAGAQVTLGLYSASVNASGQIYGSTLLTTFGTIDASSTGRKVITGLNYTIPDNGIDIFYVGFLSTGAAVQLLGPANTASVSYYGALDTSTQNRSMSLTTPIGQTITSLPSTISEATWLGYTNITTYIFIGFK